MDDDYILIIYYGYCKEFRTSLIQIIGSNQLE